MTSASQSRLSHTPSLLPVRMSIPNVVFVFFKKLKYIHVQVVRSFVGPHSLKER